MVLVAKLKMWIIEKINMVWMYGKKVTRIRMEGTQNANLKDSLEKYGGV